MIKSINHIAIIVEDIESSLEFWSDTMGMELDCVEEVPTQQAKVAFFRLGQSQIELIKPTTDDSGAALFLAKRGEGMHHIALEVQDLDSMLVRLQAKGVRLINETPLVAAQGRRAAFIHPKSANGVLVELYQLD